ncbi:MAG TPA: winged helix-turn-helix domain-containing protein [Rhizomicrobium sp.]|nr:winged helix-turn-helix domain-containing protein [Rhizomicrobium sp.]
MLGEIALIAGLCALLVLLSAAFAAQADPLPAPAMSASLANPDPCSVDLDWAGTWRFGGAALVRPELDLSNDRAWVEKTDGWWQFHVQAGAYTLPSPDMPYIKSSLAPSGAAARSVAARAAGEAPIFRSAQLTVDLVNRRVHLGAEAVHLSPKEYNLLRFPVMHAGKVVTRQQLLHEVWGPAHLEDVQYLRVLMRQLRQKLEPAGAPNLLVTEAGVGYRLPVLPVGD